MNRFEWPLKEMIFLDMFIDIVRKYKYNKNKNINVHNTFLHTV